MCCVVWVWLLIVGQSFGHKTVKRQPAKGPYTITATIHNPIVTNWGWWYEWHRCNDGEFIKAISTKSLHRWTGDDTGMEDFFSSCGEATVPDGVADTSDSTHFKCPNEAVIVGFRAKIEGAQGGGDDTSMNQVQVKCSDGSVSPAVGDTSWGEWFGWVYCPEGSAAHGYRYKWDGTGKHNPLILGEFDWAGINIIELDCRGPFLPTVYEPAQGPYTATGLIRTERESNRGQWKPWIDCNDATFAKTIRTSSKRASGDNMGMDELAMLCGDAGIHDYGHHPPPISDPLPVGMGVAAGVAAIAGLLKAGKTPHFKCPKESVIVGFKALVQPPDPEKLTKDATAVNKIRVKCSDGTMSPEIGDTPWGCWQDWALCPPGTAVYSWRVQHDDGKGVDGQDATGINNIEMRCRGPFEPRIISGPGV